MYPKSLSKEKSNLDLDTLPDFLKEPNPQVKFHSAFPPLTTKVRVRSVMERAGFDVYKPDKSEKRSTSAKPAFEPPRRIPFRSHSQSNLASLGKPPNNKGRNFTTSPMSSNSFPNLNHDTNMSNISPSLNFSDPSTTSAKPNVVEYTQNKLKLHTNRPDEKIVPKLNPEYPDYSGASVPIIPDVTLPHQMEDKIDFNNGSNESVVYKQMVDDQFKNSTNLPPKTTNLNGPQPFVDSEDDEDEENYVNHSNVHSRNSSGVTTATNELRGKLVDESQMNENFGQQKEMEIPTIPTLNEFDNSNTLRVTNNDSRLSHVSANSVSSFDAKFMNQDNYDAASQSSYGGLKDIRSTFRSADFDQYEYQAEPVHKHYENGKRLSTLSTNDTKIYNLKSLNDNHIVDMSMIQEDDNEYSMIKSRNSYNVPDIVLEDEHIDNRNSFDNLEKDDVIDTDSPDMEEYHTPAGEYTNRFEDNYEFKQEDEVEEDVQSELNDDSDNRVTEDDSASLLSRGFQKRTASAVSTPNFNQEYSDFPPVPNAPSYPIEPQINSVAQPEIEAIIDDIENFKIDPNDNNEYHGKREDLDKAGSIYESNTSPLYSAQDSQISQSQESYPTTFEEVSKNTPIEIQYPPGEGPCRKCHQDILEDEKKIWSKDHQLTGQWHRKCFGCNKCGAKFSKGSSCYVFNNEPYCEEHFHELNGSLCRICNKGVEGECLQNDINEAFHTHCLTCVICGLSVQGDYFLFRDEVMCENDAKELMYQIEEAEKEELNDDNIEKSEKMIKRRTRILYL